MSELPPSPDCLPGNPCGSPRCSACTGGRPVSRREFLWLAAAGGTTALAGAGGLISPVWSAVEASAQARRPPVTPRELPWTTMRLAPEVRPEQLTLRAAPGIADIGGGLEVQGFLVNGSLPSPVIRARKGDPFRVTMENQLPDPLILHWHGLTPPEEADGHPRFAVRPRGTFDYRFTVENRAGTYWYHSHTHYKVAEHAYRGIGGLLLVGDEEEDALELPSGPREIPLILQDRRLDRHGIPVYEHPDTMEGHIGTAPFGNGIHQPRMEVETALYRFRILNGSNARIFRLERSDGRPMILIGNDGGLLDEARSVETLDLGPAERADVLMDFRDLEVGEEFFLRTLRFEVPGGVTHGRSVAKQGEPMDLLRIQVDRKVDDPSPIPTRLSQVPLPDPDEAVRERRFEFTSDRDWSSRTMMTHRINGQEFDMNRIEERVPFGDTEIWTFTNDNGFAHPVHLHATHFRVLSRTGGRDRVFEHEAGLKDTVLLHPNETVKVAVRFTAHRGLFLLHCHNLEHEDVGMMINVLVE
jgi:FtsP/CotA-like multicopper oxidase with cupredoxin domain